MAEINILSLDREVPIYEYGIFTWGGFYNDHNKKKHGFQSSDEPVYFKTKEERQKYIEKLEDAKSKLTSRDAILMVEYFEGFHTRNLPIIHRVVEYKDKRYYSNRKWNWPEEQSTLIYFANHKWYPGFNDHVVEEQSGEEEVDYTQVKIISEWITGSFEIFNLES